MRAQIHRKKPGGGGLLSLLLKRNALQRLPNEDDQQRLIIPARISADRLLRGEAEIADLHNVTAMLNVALVLAHDIGERPARDAVQAGILALCAVKDRPGARYAVNAEQREKIMTATALADDLFSCSTLLELSTAHRKIMKTLPMTGELKLVEIEID